MTQALYFIVKTLTQLFLLLLLLRFWLPWLRADFRNPIAQGILRFTSPLIIPVRRVLPSVGRLDTATILVAFVLEFLTIFALLAIFGQKVEPIYVVWTAALELVILSLNLFFFAIIVKIVLSWVSPQSHSPITALVNTIAEPVLAPFRRIIPTAGGLDISPIFAVILLQASVIFLQSLKPIPF
jgi:YggT family protein